MSVCIGCLRSRRLDAAYVVYVVYITLYMILKTSEAPLVAEAVSSGTHYVLHRASHSGVGSTALSTSSSTQGSLESKGGVF